MDWAAAGCLFTDKHHVLGGWCQHTLPSSIGGIGGTKRAKEEPLDTAWRETIEELFEFPYIPPELLVRIKKSITTDKVMQNNAYIFYIYSLKDLEKLLAIIRTFRLISPLYRFFPRSLSDLIFKRVPTPRAEVAQLCILPLEPYVCISPDLIEDIFNVSTKVELKLAQSIYV